MKNLLANLAELEHIQWCNWAKSLMESEPNISEERKERWKQLLVPYEQLDDYYKEFDRKYARKVLAILQDYITEGRIILQVQDLKWIFKKEE